MPIPLSIAFGIVVGVLALVATLTAIRLIVNDLRALGATRAATAVLSAKRGVEEFITKEFRKLEEEHRRITYEIDDAKRQAIADIETRFGEGKISFEKRSADIRAERAKAENLKAAVTNELLIIAQIIIAAATAAARAIRADAEREVERQEILQDVDEALNNGDEILARADWMEQQSRLTARRARNRAFSKFYDADYQIISAGDLVGFMPQIQQQIASSIGKEATEQRHNFGIRMRLGGVIQRSEIQASRELTNTINAAGSKYRHSSKYLRRGGRPWHISFEIAPSHFMCVRQYNEREQVSGDVQACVEAYWGGFAATVAAHTKSEMNRMRNIGRAA